MLRLPKFSDLSLRSRFIAAFMVPACLILVAGVSGEHFLRAVSVETRNVTDVATPIFQGAQKLSALLYEMGRTSFAAFEADDEAAMQEISGKLTRLSSDFALNLSNLEKLARENLTELDRDSVRSGRTSGAEKSWSLDGARSSQQYFEKEAATAIEAQLIYRRLQKDLQQNRDDVTNEINSLENLLQEVRQTTDSAFSNNEERAKTRVQSGVATVGELNSIIQDFYDKDFPVMDSAYKLQQHLKDLRGIMQSFLGEKAIVALTELEKGYKAKSDEMISRIQRTIRRTELDSVKTILAKLEVRLIKLNQFVLGEKGLFALHRSLISAESTAQSSQKQMSESLKACETVISQFLAHVSQTNASLNLSAKVKINEALSRAQFSAIALAVVGFVLSTLLGLLVAGSLSRPIRKLADQASLVSQGDLTLDIDARHRRDEIGVLSQAFANMVDSLRSQTRQITEGVNVLAGSAGAMSATAAQVSESISRASSVITETTSTAEELRQAGKVSADKAKLVTETAHEAVQASTQGTEAANETIAKMNLIKDQVTSISDTVIRLNENTLAIGTIIQTVQDLAEQSNLLAVNASIEAARAGDQGKGFAVVAQEIKSLADQSKKGTEQIAGILEEITKAVNGVVMATEQGHRAVREGVEQSMRSADSIRELEIIVARSSQAASVIDASTSQQFTGIDQVVEAMSNIEGVMHQLVAASGQLKSGASRLSDLGNDLNLIVQKYKS
ncbi:MAG: methyl-accepting chemotaxis protein [Desulfomonilaceae bacterium]